MANEAKTIISIIKSTIVDENEDPQGVVETNTPDPTSTPPSEQSKFEETPAEPSTPQEDGMEEEIEGIKDLLNYLKDLNNPKSSGLELSDEEQKSLEDWIKEIKREEELIKLRDFLKGM